MCKNVNRETIDELQVALAVQAYDGLTLARGDLQHHCAKSLCSMLQNLEHLHVVVHLLLSYLHYTLVAYTSITFFKGKVADPFL
jgi:hypothetical protein